MMMTMRRSPLPISSTILLLFLLSSPTFVRSSNNYNYESSSRYDDVSNRGTTSDRSAASSAFTYSYDYDEKRSNPIDYNFKSSSSDFDNNDYRDGDSERMYESPKAKRDLLTRYTSTKVGKMKVAMSSMLLGYGFGMMISKFIHLPDSGSVSISVITAVCALVLNFFRTVYSELLRSLALVLILTVTKTRDIRRRYPTLSHIKSILRPNTCPRKPFPYDGNPWQYNGERYEEFNMLYTALAMGLIGGVIGGNIPLVPTFLGGPIGCAAFAFVSTLQDAKGDLARSMGMKVVAAGEELLYMQSELSIVSKTMTVANRILDKLLILDRKHRIKDKIIRFVQWGYEKTMNAVSEAQESAQRKDNDDRRRQERPSDERRRPTDDNREQRGYGRDDYRRESLNDDQRRSSEERRDRNDPRSGDFQRERMYNEDRLPRDDINNSR